ncbi:hypothetical protein [Agrobacterium sp.]|uniref:hypothetical protein n=1 Tax=Agrobacterium sp. TaxID=361 RepID=UPI0028A5E2AE
MSHSKEKAFGYTSSTLRGIYQMLELFELAVAAVKDADNNGDTKPIDDFIASYGFSKCPAEDDRYMWGHERVDGEYRILIQYRFYDTSKAFSIQPDMNVYLLKLSKDGQIIKEDFAKFLDRSIY